MYNYNRTIRECKSFFLKKKNFSVFLLKELFFMGGCLENPEWCAIFEAVCIIYGKENNEKSEWNRSVRIACHVSRPCRLRFIFI